MKELLQVRHDAGLGGFHLEADIPAPGLDTRIALLDCFRERKELLEIRIGRRHPPRRDAMVTEAAESETAVGSAQLGYERGRLAGEAAQIEGWHVFHVRAALSDAAFQATRW